MKNIFLFGFILCSLPTYILGKTVAEYEKEIEQKKEELTQELNKIERLRFEKPIECEKKYGNQPGKFSSCLEKVQNDLEAQTKVTITKYNKEIEELEKKREEQWITEYIESKKRIETVTKK